METKEERERRICLVRNQQDRATKKNDEGHDVLLHCFRYQVSGYQETKEFNLELNCI